MAKKRGEATDRVLERMEWLNALEGRTAIGSVGVGADVPTNHTIDPALWKSTPYVPPVSYVDQDISATDNFLTIAGKTRKDLGDLPAQPSTLENLSRGGKDNSIMGSERTILVGKREGSGRLSNWSRMKAASARTAADMVNGTPMAGYYVMTDRDRWLEENSVSRSAGRKLGRGVPYDIALTPLENGRVNIAGTPMGDLVDPSEGMFELELGEGQAQDFLKVFKPLLPAGSPDNIDEAAAAQINQVVHDRALNVARKYFIQNPEALIDSLENAKMGDFYRLDALGHDITYSATGMEASALDRALGSRANAVLRQVFDPMRANPERALRVIKGVRKELATAWKASGSPGNFEDYFKTEWSRFANPVLDSVTRPSRWVFNPGQNYAMMKMFDESIMGNKSAGGMISQLLAQKANELQVLKKNGAFARMLGSTSEVGRIRNRLAYLDELESSLAKADPTRRQVDSTGYQLGLNKRVKAFDRELSRWKGKYGFLDSYNSAYPENPLELHVRFHESTRTTGAGVTFTLAPKGMKTISRGDSRVLQSYLPIVDQNGEFTTSRGTRFVTRNLLVPNKAIREAPITSAWSKSSAILAHGFRWFDNQTRPYQEFSAQEALVAAQDEAHARAENAMLHNRFDIASNILSGREHTLQESLHMAYPKDYTMADWPYRRSISMPRAFFENYLSPHGMSRRSIDMERLAQFVIDPNPIYNHIRVKKGKIVPDASLSSDELSILNRARKLHKALYQQAFSGQKDISHGAIAKRLSKLIGTNPGNVADTIFRGGEDIIRRSGLTALGREAESNDAVFFDSVSNASLYGGISRIRPHQLMKNIELPATDDIVAGSQLMGYSDLPEIQSPTRWRNTNVGLVFSGQEVDEAGNPVGGVLSGEDMMRKGSFFEQQVLTRPGLEQKFGVENLNNLKLVFDATKGTVTVAGKGNLLEMEPGPIDTLLGVDAKKIMDKHDSASMLMRGWTARLLTEAGEDSGYVQDELRKLYGSDVSFAAHDGIMEMRSAFGSTLIPRLAELSSVFDGINARRQARAAERHEEYRAINQFTSQYLKVNSQRYRVDVAHVLSPTAIMSDPVSYTEAKTIEQAMNKGGLLPIRASASDIGMDVMTLNRIHFAGAPTFSAVLAEAAALGKKKSGVFYKVQQNIAAYGGTFLPNRMGLNTSYEAMGSDIQHMSMEDLALRQRTERAPSDMTREEYEARYGTGPMSFDLAAPVNVGEYEGVTKIVAPDDMSVPDASGYNVSDTQKAVDNIIHANKSYLEDPSDKAHEYLTRTVENYEKTLRKQATGKGGAIARAFKKIDLEGQGIWKPKFGYNQMVGMTYDDVNAARAEAGLAPIAGEGEVIRPGDTAISMDVAEAMGIVEPTSPDRGKRAKAGSDLAAWRAQNLERGYAYGATIREPSVQQGGMLSRLVIDPLHGTAHQMDSGRAFVHEMWRDPANADFDGDAGRIIAAGFIGKSKPSLEVIRTMEGSIQDVLDQMTKTFDIREANKTANLAEAKAITDDMLGRAAVQEILEGKDINTQGLPYRDWFNQQTEGIDRGTLLNEEMKYRLQQDTANAKGISGDITDATQNYLMTRAMAADSDPLAKKIYQDIYSNFGTLREGILKTKSNKSINPWKIVAGFGDEPNAPALLAEEINKSFVNPALEKAAKGDFAAAVEAARYSSIVDFVSYMHDQNPNWFKEVIRPEEGSLLSATKSDSLFSYKSAMEDMNMLFGGMKITKEQAGKASKFINFVQGRMKVVKAEQDLRDHLEATGQSVQDYEQETGTKLTQDLEGAPEALVPSEVPIPSPEEVIPLPPSLPLPPVQNISEAVEAQSAIAAEQVERSSAAAAESAKILTKKSPWALAAGLGVAALGGAMVFRPQGTQTPPQHTTHRVMPEDRGYNIMVHAKDDSSRPTQDYGKMAMVGTGGNLNVHIKDNRSNLNQSQQDASIGALKGR